MERIREISINIEVDTNKRTIKKELSYGDFDGTYDEFIEACKELMQEVLNITDN